MGTIDLAVRYFQDSPPEGQPCREELFIRREVTMSLQVGQTALVLVDVWNNHFIESWLERAFRVTREAVVPVLEAARAAALTIVHAPSPEVAEQFGQLARHRPPPPEPETGLAPRRVPQPDWGLCRLPRASQPAARDSPDRAAGDVSCHRSRG